MIFSYDKFLRPLTSSDNEIHIYDNDGNIIYVINPFQISSSISSNNVLKINIRKGKVISISFSSANESKLALSILQIQVDELKTKMPIFIDKQIENYISGTSGSGTSGTSGTSGYDGTSGISGTQYNDLRNLCDNNLVTVGQRYLITDRGDLGLLVYGDATNEIAVRADGGFLNADWQGGGDYSGVLALTGIAPNTNLGQWRPITADIEYKPYITTLFQQVSSLSPMAIGDTLTGSNGSTAKVRAIGDTEKVYLNGEVQVGDIIQIRDNSSVVLQQGELLSFDTDTYYGIIGNLTQPYFADGLGYDNFLDITCYYARYTNTSAQFNPGDVITDDQGNTATVVVVQASGADGTLIVSYLSGKIGDVGATTFDGNGGGHATIDLITDIQNTLYNISPAYNADITVTLGDWGGAGFFTDDDTSATMTMFGNSCLGFNTQDPVNDIMTGASGIIRSNNNPQGFAVSTLSVANIAGDFMTGDRIEDGFTGQMAEVGTISYTFNPQIGDIVIYNNLHWQKISNILGNDNTPPDQSADYSFLPKNAPNVGYRSVWNKIEYDFVNDQIYFRHDHIFNVDYRGSGGIPRYPWGRAGWGDNHINMGSMFNDNCVGNIYSNTLSENSEISGNQLDEGCSIHDNTLAIRAIMNNNVLTGSSQIQENDLGSYSEMGGNYLYKGIYLNRNVLEFRTYIRANTLMDYSTISENRLTGESANISQNNINQAGVANNDIGPASSIRNNIFSGGDIIDNMLGKDSDINNNVLSFQSTIRDNYSVKSGHISSNNLGISSHIDNNQINEATIDSNTLGSNSSIRQNVMTNSQINSNQLLCIGGGIARNILPIGSAISNNIFSAGPDSAILENILNMTGSISTNILALGAGITGNQMLGSRTLNSITRIDNNELLSGGGIANNVLYGGAMITQNTLNGGCVVDSNVFKENFVAQNNNMVPKSRIVTSTFGQGSILENSHLLNGSGIVETEVGPQTELRNIYSLNQCKIGSNVDLNQADTYLLSYVTLNSSTSLVQTANVFGTPTHTDDADALSAGLVSGMYYKTTTAGVTSLNVIP